MSSSVRLLSRARANSGHFPRRGGLVGRLILVGIVCCLAFAGPVAPPPQGGEAATLLTWARPALANPITIKLGTGPTSHSLNPSKDYVIRFPRTKKVGYTLIEGGRNIVIIGGHITIPSTAGQVRGALYIKGATGTVHIEGLLIDGSGGRAADGIDIAAPRAVVQLQNIRVVGLHGTYDGHHADIVQPFGGVGELRIDRRSDYQGLFLKQEPNGPIGAIDLRRIDLSYPAANPHGNTGSLLWLTHPDLTGCAAPPTRLAAVYVTPRGGQALGDQAIWPNTHNPPTCRAVQQGERLRFPATPAITGEVRLGPPPGGSFVPPGVAGLGYTTPGYAGRQPLSPPSNPPPPTEELSRLAIVGATAATPSNDPTRAYDGVPTTSWHTDKSRPDSTWIRFDLGQVRTVRKISWKYHVSGAADSVQIMVSSNGVEWTTLARRRNSPPKRWESIETDSSARFIQFLYANPNGDRALGYLAEVRVWSSIGQTATIASQDASTEDPAPRTSEREMPRTADEPAATETTTTHEDAPEENAAKVKLSRTRAQVGQRVTVRGSHVEPGDVAISWDTPKHVIATAKPGKHKIILTDASGRRHVAIILIREPCRRGAVSLPRSARDRSVVRSGRSTSSDKSEHRP